MQFADDSLFGRDSRNDDFHRRHFIRFVRFRLAFHRLLGDAHRCVLAHVGVVAFRFRDVRSQIAVDVFLTLATTATTAATATTTLFALTRHRFLIDRRNVFSEGGLVLRHVLCDLGIGLRQRVRGFRLRLATLAALSTFATFTTLAAFLAFATRGAFDCFRTVGAAGVAVAAFTAFTAFACFARLTVLTRFAVATRFACFPCLARFTAFAWFPDLASLASFTRFAFLTTLRRLLALTAAVCTFTTRCHVTAARAATAIAVTVAAALAGTLTALRPFAALRTGLLFCRSRRNRCRRRRLYAEQILQPADEAAARLRHRNRSRCRDRTNRRARRRLLRRDALDRRFLLRLHFLGALAVAGFRLELASRFLGHLPGRARLVEAGVVVTQAFQLVMRRVQMLVRHQHDVDLEARLDLVDFRAFFVQQEGGHLDRHLAMDRRGVFLHRFFLNDPQHLQRGRFGIADVTRAVTARAGHVAAFRQRRTQTLTRQFHQAEARNLAHLDARAVVLERVFQALFDFALALGRLHVDEVDHDQAAQVAQTQLARDFVGGFEVRARGCFLDVGALGGAGRVHVDGDECFRVVDHDRAARRQRHRARVRRFDLMLDLEAREQRHVVVVALHLADVVRHHDVHEGARLVMDFGGVDQNFADIRLEIVANRANHEARFEVNQHRLAGRTALRRGFDRAPQLHQVVQVPLQFFGAAANAGRARDDAHAFRQLQLRHGFAQFLTVVAFDPARHAAAARVIRHQHQITAGERDERGQGRALVAALFFFDLNDQFLTFLERVLDAGGAHVDAVAEILAGDFLERQETVAVFAVVDETGFERRLDAGDDALVNVAFALFAPGGFDVDVDEFLPIDDGDAQFFLLRRIEQHAFH
ncbi:hypothetical protein BgramDRAFT_5354 [Paraburkholderia graminis C4D1M]|uniref:NAD-specific glutamate dehydrogenase n=1 Tax=Paraburkholderia graminis (strain ATCC 700544 / DSM 17151 / LMG 18924 / NCIMB 13744 / C4D1M) TaxID=396598 RepID=B1G7P6_PARG4|nr:hypothetical protein BgramDRAFT_5354 [Paraburkholderia graminis C4D1M]